MRTILILVVIVVLAMLGWNWYQSEDNDSLRGTIYQRSNSSLNTEDDTDDEQTISPDQTGIRASGSLEGTIR